MTVSGGPTVTEQVARPVAPPPTPARHRQRSRPRRHAGWTGALTLYLIGSLALHHRVLGDLGGRAIGWASSDSDLFVWWLRWLPYAVGQGQNPLYSTWLAAPTGVNAMWNTSTPLLATLLSPITLTAGATAAFNVGMILGPPVSALACFLALRPWASTWAARALGGAAFGFSPFVVAHASVGHLNLVWAVLPPVLLWAVRAVLVEQRHPYRDGALLGLAVALQLGLYTQTVALGLVAAAVAGLVLAARWPGEVATRLPNIARSVAAAAGVVVVACAYPLWLLLAGPARPLGQIRDPAKSGADLAGFVAPSPLVKLSLGLDAFGRDLFDGGATEAGTYVGVVLLVLAAVTVAVVRSTAVRVLAGVGVVVAVLSLGPHLRVARTDLPVPLPGAVLHPIPLVGQLEGARFGVIVALVVAVLVAVALDRALSARRWLVAGLVVVAAATWVPSNSVQASDAGVPPFFAAGAPGLSPADVVATVPRTTGKWVDGAVPMRWQAAADMRFRLSSGYFIGSLPGRPLALEVPAGEFDVGRDAAAARDELDRRGVTAVVIGPSPDTVWPAALDWTRRVTGRPGEPVGGVWLFRR